MAFPNPVAPKLVPVQVGNVSSKSFGLAAQEICFFGEELPTTCEFSVNIFLAVKTPPPQKIKKTGHGLDTRIQPSSSTCRLGLETGDKKAKGSQAKQIPEYIQVISVTLDLL